MPLPSRSLAARFVVSAALACLAATVIGAKAPPPRASSSSSAALAARLDAALSRAPVPEAGRCVEIRYEGVVELEAHYRRPGEKRPYRSRERFLTDGRGTVRRDWTTWTDGDSVGAPESWLLARGVLLYRQEPGRPWRAVAADRREIEMAQVLAGVPWEIARVLRSRLAAGTLRGSGGGAGGVWSVSDPRAPAAGALTLRPQDGTVVSYVTNRAHPRLGDVRDGVVYTYTEPGPAPTELREIIHERDQQWALAERRVAYRTDAPEESLLVMPASFEPAPAPPDSAASQPKVEALAPGLWSIDLEDLDSRSIVAEFADHLAVIEAAVSSQNGERIVDLAKRRWPAKPIRWFLFSHHHPHYAGGLRAFVAAGATIVTTPGNEAFVRQAAAWPFALQPDRLARSKRPLLLRTFQRRFDVSDSTNRIVAVDIGTRSDHTDEFVIFSFPRQRLLFQSEQGWVTVDGKVRASRRAERFLKTLDEEGVAADRLVQSWPMRGNRAELSRVELDSLVVARKR